MMRYRGRRSRRFWHPVYAFYYWTTYWRLRSPWLWSECDSCWHPRWRHWLTRRPHRFVERKPSAPSRIDAFMPELWSAEMLGVLREKFTGDRRSW